MATTPKPIKRKHNIYLLYCFRSTYLCGKEAFSCISQDSFYGCFSEWKAIIPRVIQTLLLRSVEVGRRKHFHASPSAFPSFCFLCFVPKTFFESESIVCPNRQTEVSFFYICFGGYNYQNLHCKLGQQTPSVGTPLAYFETTA